MMKKHGPTLGSICAVALVLWNILEILCSNVLNAKYISYENNNNIHIMQNI